MRFEVVGFFSKPFALRAHLYCSVTTTGFEPCGGCLLLVNGSRLRRRRKGAHAIVGKRGEPGAFGGSSPPLQTPQVPRQLTTERRARDSHILFCFGQARAEMLAEHRPRLLQDEVTSDRPRYPDIEESVTSSRSTRRGGGGRPQTTQTPGRSSSAARGGGVAPRAASSSAIASCPPWTAAPGPSANASRSRNDDDVITVSARSRGTFAKVRLVRFFFSPMPAATKTSRRLCSNVRYFPL